MDCKNCGTAIKPSHEFSGRYVHVASGVSDMIEFYSCELANGLEWKDVWRNAEP